MGVSDLRVLVTGAGGQLGLELNNLMEKDVTLFNLGKDELNIDSLDCVLRVVRSIKPCIIINLAANNYVDKSEVEKEKAFLTNAIGAKNVAIAANENQAKILHLSTDYVFDGDKKSPYLEYDSKMPVNAYGLSKHYGEEMVKEVCPRHFIIRTSWLYGRFGNNFVKTILDALQSKDKLSIVTDQVGSPTYTKDLANVIKILSRTDAYGTYHVANQGYCSWYDFTAEIVKLSGRNIRIEPISSLDLNRLARRPSFSALDNLLLKLQLGIELRPWQYALKEHIKELHGR